MAAALITSKLANAEAALEPSALLITRSVRGVMLMCPACVAKPCRVTMPLLTCSRQGVAWPPLSSRRKVPSAPVLPDSAAPDAHLAARLALASAAPVAASPVMVGLAGEEPPPPPQATRRVATPSAASWNLICLIHSLLGYIKERPFVYWRVMLRPLRRRGLAGNYRSPVAVFGLLLFCCHCSRLRASLTSTGSGNARTAF